MQRISWKRLGMLTVALAAVTLLTGQTCTGGFGFALVVPRTAEATETQSIAMPAGAVLRVKNDIGSTRVTVDPTATEATVEIKRVSQAGNQDDADAVLAEMSASITTPTAGNNALVITAEPPPSATSDPSEFTATVTDEGLVVTGVFTHRIVAKFEIFVTLPAGHRVEIEHGFGGVRTIALDTPSTVDLRSGKYKSVNASTSITATVNAGDIEFDSHTGSVNANLEAGQIDLEVLDLASGDNVLIRIESGSLDLELTRELDAVLKAVSGLGAVSFRPSDFTAATVATQTLTRVEATLNAGGPSIDAAIDVGQIDIDSF